MNCCIVNVICRGTESEEEMERDATYECMGVKIMQLLGAKYMCSMSTLDMNAEEHCTSLICKVL